MLRNISKSANSVIPELAYGCPKPMNSRSGRQETAQPAFGAMKYISKPALHDSLMLDLLKLFVAGSGKTILAYLSAQPLSIRPVTD